MQRKKELNCCLVLTVQLPTCTAPMLLAPVQEEQLHCFLRSFSFFFSSLVLPALFLFLSFFFFSTSAACFFLSFLFSSFFFPVASSFVFSCVVQCCLFFFSCGLDHQGKKTYPPSCCRQPFYQTTREFHLSS